ncbi:MAG: DUF937 domain-containing protein [Mogibacterium sp.]|nr:DUF937 domain-containing protein [Mogibacterium sp.]
MDMNDILKMMIASGALEQISQQTGVSSKDAANVLEDVLPVLLMGMQGQAKNKNTQQGFLQALQDHGKQDTSDMNRFLRNVDTDDGAKIVNHLLGSKQEEVAAKARKKSGIDTKTILKIMAILAPLLMTKMGNTAQSKAKKSSSSDMMSVVGGMLDGVDAGDVIKLAGLLLK